jgi:hypothetical protein
MRTSASSLIEAELVRVPNSTTGGYSPVVGIAYYTVGAPHDAGGEWSYIQSLGGKRRIIDVRASIEPFSQTCTITLDNSEGSYDSTASTYKGKWLKIDWGFTIGGSSRYPSQASIYFYCTGYTFTSALVNGRALDVVKFYGEGAWNRLGRLMAVPDLSTPADGAPYYYNQPTMDATRDNMDADDIFAAICDMAGIAKSTLGSWSDYITSWEPECTFDYDTTVAGHIGPTGDVACMLLLQPFRVRAVPRADKLYLTVPGTTTNWTFKCPSDVNFQPFISGSKTSQEAYPAKVAVVNGSYGGTYGTSSVGGYNYALAEAWNIGSSNTNCAWIAQSIVELIAEQQDSGIIEVPVLNPLLELYDYVTVIDQRGQCSTTTGRVGGLSYQYTPSQGIYSMRVRLGGVWGLPEGVTELTGGKPEPTKGSGSSSGGSSSSGGGSSGSGSSNYNNRASTITGLTTYVPGIRAGELVIGDLVTGDLADLTTKQYSDLTGLPTSLADIAPTEYTTLTYAEAAIGAGGLLKTYVYGPGLKDLSMTGKVAGLYLTKTHMGYWNGSSWNNYFDNAGNGYFRGTIYAAAVATGYTLTVGGNIDVITDGGSFAGIRLGTHTINGSIFRGIDIFGDVMNFWDDSGTRRGYVTAYSGHLAMIAHLNTHLLLQAGTGNINITGGSGKDIILSVSSGGRIKLINLPSSDPHEVGAIYFDAGTGILHGSLG